MFYKLLLKHIFWFCLNIASILKHFNSDHFILQYLKSVTLLKLNRAVGPKVRTGNRNLANNWPYCLANPWTNLFLYLSLSLDLSLSLIGRVYGALCTIRRLRVDHRGLHFAFTCLLLNLKVRDYFFFVYFTRRLLLKGEYFVHVRGKW